MSQTTILGPRCSISTRFRGVSSWRYEKRADKVKFPAVATKHLQQIGPELTSACLVAGQGSLLLHARPWQGVEALAIFGFEVQASGGTPVHDRYGTFMQQVSDNAGCTTFVFRMRSYVCCQHLVRQTIAR